MSRARALARPLASAYARALVVVKTTPVAEFTSLVGAGDFYDSRTYAVARHRHETHRTSCDGVRALLRRYGVEYRCVERQSLSEGSIGDADLVIALGGDGTTLACARATRGRDGTPPPILGINTDPATRDELRAMYLTGARVDERRSTGHLCAANRFDAEATLEAALEGRLRPTRLARIKTTLNGRELEYALNDVLIAHPSPASVSRYSVRLPRGANEREDAPPKFFHVRSSGLRTCTATGSTAAMYSAGGDIMPLDSTQMQYMDREPIYYDHAPTPSAGRGYYERGDAMSLRWNSRKGAIYIDGDHVKHDVALGDDIEMSTDAPEVNLFVSEWFKQARASGRLRRDR